MRTLAFLIVLFASATTAAAQCVEYYPISPVYAPAPVMGEVVYGPIVSGTPTYAEVQCGPNGCQVTTRPRIISRRMPSSAGRTIMGLPPAAMQSIPAQPAPPLPTPPAQTAPSQMTGAQTVPGTSREPGTNPGTNGGIRPACQCPRLKASIQAIVHTELAPLSAKIDALAAKVETSGQCTCDLTPILEKLQEIEAQITAGAYPPDELAAIKQQLDALRGSLTALNGKVDNANTGQTQIAEGLAAVATAQTGTNAKLAEALELLKKGQHLTLTVQSTPNLPASYVDTSTIWAIQQKTGLSHVVMVCNSADPEWERLKPEYEKARHKFPAMQLVDVQSQDLKISPTPQLVLYYAEEGHAPEVISGDRAVGAKLRELYTN